MAEGTASTNVPAVSGPALESGVALNPVSSGVSVGSGSVGGVGGDEDASESTVVNVPEVSDSALGSVGIVSPVSSSSLASSSSVPVEGKEGGVDELKVVDVPLVPGPTLGGVVVLNPVASGVPSTGSFGVIRHDLGDGAEVPAVQALSRHYMVLVRKLNQVRIYCRIVHAVAAWLILGRPVRVSTPLYRAYSFIGLDGRPVRGRLTLDQAIRLAYYHLNVIYGSSLAGVVPPQHFYHPSARVVVTELVDFNLYWYFSRLGLVATFPPEWVTEHHVIPTLDLPDLGLSSVRFWLGYIIARVESGLGPAPNVPSVDVVEWLCHELGDSTMTQFRLRHEIESRVIVRGRRRLAQTSSSAEVQVSEADVSRSGAALEPVVGDAKVDAALLDASQEVVEEKRPSKRGRRRLVSSRFGDVATDYRRGVSARVREEALEEEVKVAKANARRLAAEKEQMAQALSKVGGNAGGGSSVAVVPVPDVVQPLDGGASGPSDGGSLPVLDVQAEGDDEQDHQRHLSRAMAELQSMTREERVTAIAVLLEAFSILDGGMAGIDEIVSLVGKRGA